MIALLQEIVESDGDVLVMHDGEKPYVVTASGKVQPIRSVVVADTFREVVEQFLPEHLRHVLREVGGVEYDLPPLDKFPHEHFTVVASCVDDTVHAEIRRRILADDLVPDELFEPTWESAAGDVVPSGASAQVGRAAPTHSASAQPSSDDDLTLPTLTELWPEDAMLSHGVSNSHVETGVEEMADWPTAIHVSTPTASVDETASTADHVLPAAFDIRAEAGAGAAAAAAAQAARDAVAEAVPAAVAAAVADAVPKAVADAARIAVGNVAAATVAQAARDTVAEAAPAAVATAAADAVSRAVADASRHAASEVTAAVVQAARETVTSATTAAVAAAVADTVPGAVADAARHAVGHVAAAAVAQAARDTVAEAVPAAVAAVATDALSRAVADASRHAASEVTAAVVQAARETVTSATTAAVAAAVADTVPGAVADAARQAVGHVAAAAVAQAARETVAEAVPAAVAAVAADALSRAVADASRHAAGEVTAAVVQAARETVTNATNAAVTVAVADTVPGAVADAARIAVGNVAAAAVEQAARSAAAEVAPALVSAAVFGAVADAVPRAVAEAVRNAVGDAAAAVSQAARETVAEMASGAVVDAARAAVAAAAAVAVTDAAREIVAEVASAAVAGAVPGAVIDAARTATAALVLPAVEKAARERVAEAVPPAVAGMARMAVSEAAAAAVAHAAGEAVARLAPAAVVDAARIAVNEGVAAAVAEAARETVAEAAPAAMVAAVSAAVAAAVPGAVADAARVAVADVAAAAVAKAVAAALSAAATATEARITSGDVSGASLLSGERSSQPRAEVMPPGEVVKPFSAAVLEFAPSRHSPPRALSPERAPEAVSPPAGDARLDVERLLRAAAARRTTTLYLFSNAQPSIWVDGQLQIMDGEPVFSASDVVSLLLTTMQEANREALQMGVATEWTRDVEGIGRVNGRTFSDHRGPGGVFRLPVPAFTADQLGLTQDIQSLAQYPDGLVLVAGSRFSDRQMLTSALVDLINRTRQGYIITLEEEVSVVHGSGHSVISQRQVRPSEDDLLAAARSALRENPNVLLLDEIRTGASMNVALEAASSGRLIIGGLRAHSASEAIDRIVGFYAPEHSRQIRLALVANLRGIVAQVLLTDRRGGRVAAREVVNTPGIAAFITGETTEQPSSATEGGRRDRMVPLTDVLADYVEHGVVDEDEAYRHVTDRSAFTALLKGRGIDSGRKLPGSLG